MGDALTKRWREDRGRPQRSRVIGLVATRYFNRHFISCAIQIAESTARSGAVARERHLQRRIFDKAMACGEKHAKARR